MLGEGASVVARPQMPSGQPWSVRRAEAPGLTPRARRSRRRRRRPVVHRETTRERERNSVASVQPCGHALNMRSAARASIAPVATRLLHLGRQQQSGMVFADCCFARSRPPSCGRRPFAGCSNYNSNSHIGTCTAGHPESPEERPRSADHKALRLPASRRHQTVGPAVDQ